MCEGSCGGSGGCGCEGCECAAEKHEGQPKSYIWLMSEFSLGMLPALPGNVALYEMTLDEVKESLSQGFESAIRREDLAHILSKHLGFHVHFSNLDVKLSSGMPAILVRIEKSQDVGQNDGMSSIPIEHYPRVIRFFKLIYTDTLPIGI